MSQLYGCDISEFQGQIDWDTLNSVANFVIIRGSFGTARKDYQFDRNQAEARRVQAQAGPLGIGYYYFAYPTLVDAVSSANYFIDNLGKIQEGECLFLDLEGNVGNDPVGWSKAFLDQVAQRTNGTKALLYINQSLMNSHDWSPVINGGYGLWLADYDGNKTGPGVNTPWPVTAIRQWTDKDDVAGIPTQVDGDVFYGDFNAWDAYGYHAAAASQPEPAPAPAPEPAPAPSPEPTPEPVVATPPPATPPTEPSPSTSSNSSTTIPVTVVPPAPPVASKGSWLQRLIVVIVKILRWVFNK